MNGRILLPRHLCCVAPFDVVDCGYLFNQNDARISLKPPCAHVKSSLDLNTVQICGVMSMAITHFIHPNDTVMCHYHHRHHYFDVNVSPGESLGGSNLSPWTQRRALEPYRHKTGVKNTFNLTKKPGSLQVS